MATVWASSDRDVPVERLADGDYVLCPAADGALAVGHREHEGLAWLEPIDPTTLPETCRQAIDAALAEGGLVQPADQAALLIAVTGIESALRDRGA